MNLTFTSAAATPMPRHNQPQANLQKHTRTPQSPAQFQTSNPQPRPKFNRPKARPNANQNPSQYPDPKITIRSSDNSANQNPQNQPKIRPDIKSRGAKLRRPLYRSAASPLVLSVYKHTPILSINKSKKCQKPNQRPSPVDKFCTERTNQISKQFYQVI